MRGIAVTARTPRSRKKKGRRGCEPVREALIAKYACHPDDVRIASSGQTGPDLLLSPSVQVRHPFTYEVKFRRGFRSGTPLISLPLTQSIGNVHVARERADQKRPAGSR
ncbi:MAG: hypothetical protein NT074_07245 [Methanomicrobiales archaeon]|nr:hypothetical protein [Methanomicrobiales archaeon]